MLNDKFLRNHPDWLDALLETNTIFNLYIQKTNTTDEPNSEFLERYLQDNYKEVLTAFQTNKFPIYRFDFSSLEGPLPDLNRFAAYHSPTLFIFSCILPKKHSKNYAGHIQSYFRTLYATIFSSFKPDNRALCSCMDTGDNALEGNDGATNAENQDDISDVN